MSLYKGKDSSGKSKIPPLPKEKEKTLSRRARLHNKLERTKHLRSSLTGERKEVWVGEVDVRKQRGTQRSNRGEETKETHVTKLKKHFRLSSGSERPQGILKSKTLYFG